MEARGYNLDHIINPIGIGPHIAEGDLDTTPQNSIDGRIKSVNSDSRHSALEVLSATSHEKQPVPDMWSLEYIGLYCQYASIGLMYGSTGALIPFCVYTFDGPSNVCSNARNVTTFAWNLKIFYAILVDSYRPFGMRRKPWMLFGWGMVLILFLILAITADQMSITGWLLTLLFTQAFAMFSDVPADGYSVELGRLESDEQRGQILATGQRVRFAFCVVAGVIQTFLLNGPSTNDSDCEINFQNCWSWGLTINGYYGLLFAMILILSIPILWLKELDATHIPQHSMKHFFLEIWETLKNLTTYYLVIFVIGVCGFTNFTNNANIQLQYYVIKLTNFQAGIDTITTYASLVLAIWLFQKYMIHYNWRVTQVVSVFIAAGLGLVWIAPYYNAGGTQDPWFTIFIDLDTTFAQGLSQVLYSMAVIELAKPGQEATTYELLITVGNSAILVNGIIATQLLTAFQGVGCTPDDDAGTCSSDTVDTTSRQTYEDSNGPERFTDYTLVLNAISVVFVSLFVWYLPRTKEECYEWKELGEKLGTSRNRGILTLVIITVVIVYGITAAILLLDVDTACLEEVGGSGC